MFFLPTQTYEITEKELIIDKIMYNVGNFSKRTPKSNINVSFKVIGKFMQQLAVIVENNETQLLQLLHVQNCF